MKTMFGIILFCCLVGGFVHYDSEHAYGCQAIRAIVGEAANQDDYTMDCIAHAIRNRGTLKGVYGINAKHVDSEPPEVWKRAAEAWDISDGTYDLVHGAKNFGTAADFPLTADWPKFTKHCGDFYFY